jgi:hypothetical protein
MDQHDQVVALAAVKHVAPDVISRLVIDAVVVDGGVGDDKVGDVSTWSRSRRGELQGSHLLVSLPALPLIPTAVGDQVVGAATFVDPVILLVAEERVIAAASIDHVVVEGVDHVGALAADDGVVLGMAEAGVVGIAHWYADAGRGVSGHLPHWTSDVSPPAFEVEQHDPFIGSACAGAVGVPRTVAQMPTETLGSER